MSAASDLLDRAPRSTVRAVERVLQAGKNTTQEALITRTLNALADAVPHMSPHAAGDAVGEASGYNVLLRILEQPEVLAVLHEQNPLAPAFVRGLRGREELLQAEGGAIGASEAAKLLGVTRQSVDNRRRANQLIGLSLGRRGFLYPIWQFTQNGTLPGLIETLAALQRFSPWMQVQFMTTGDTHLGGSTPLMALQEGRAHDVLRAAQAFGEHGAS